MNYFFFKRKLEDACLSNKPGEIGEPEVEEYRACTTTYGGNTRTVVLDSTTVAPFSSRPSPTPSLSFAGELLPTPPLPLTPLLLPHQTVPSRTTRKLSTFKRCLDRKTGNTDALLPPHSHFRPSSPCYSHSLALPAGETSLFKAQTWIENQGRLDHQKA